MFKLFVLCICVVHAAVAMIGELSRAQPQRPRHVEEPRTDFWNQGKPRTLFARRAVVQYQRLGATKPHVEAVPVAPRCARATESCVPHSRCCDPCASCHCRFFNIVCYCWKLGRLCQKQT